MFTDYVKIFAAAGKGGNGAISFRHEKYDYYKGKKGNKLKILSMLNKSLNIKINYKEIFTLKKYNN